MVKKWLISPFCTLLFGTFLYRGAPVMIYGLYYGVFIVHILSLYVVEVVYIKKNITGLFPSPLSMQLVQKRFRRVCFVVLVYMGQNNVRTSTFSAGDLPPMCIDEK